MKRLLLFFSVLVLISGTSFTQTGSDYYLPLKIGNYIKFHTTNNQNWGPRTTIFSIEGKDLISGVEYFREKGYEIADGSTDINVFRMAWLREDASGNIIMGAVSPSGSPNLDSAIIINFPLHPNEYLTPGYSRTFPFGDYFETDSVLSVDETVTSAAGTFNNCIKIVITHADSSGVTIFREYQYYAPNVGFVLNVRDIPIDQTHTDQLMEYNIVMAAEEDGTLPNAFSLKQNYPNPFNPATTISFSLPEKAYVSLRVFDIMGSEVASLLSKELSAGDHSVQWTAANITSGIYFYRIEAGVYSETRKLILIK